MSDNDIGIKLKRSTMSVMCKREKLGYKKYKDITVKIRRPRIWF